MNRNAYYYYSCFLLSMHATAEKLKKVPALRHAAGA